MPADHGLGFHDEQSVLPLRSEASQKDPERTVNAVEGRSGALPFQYRKLLA